jgi:adenylate cyclase
MSKEIERKFLVQGEDWRGAEGTMYRQGYLSMAKERTVRVRMAGDKGYLTIKGISKGATRTEYEYDIPIHDAQEMLDHLCERPLIEKRRHKISYDGMTWEVDVFLGDNEGLVLAEVELQSEDQPVAYPPWIGREVTDDARYFNVNLVQHPYREWS